MQKVKSKILYLFCLLNIIILQNGFLLQAQDIPINQNLSWNGESSLAINPVNHNNLVVAWMKLTGIGEVTIAVSASFDGGLTWFAPVHMPHFFVNATSADPTLSFRNDGMLFLSYIDYRLTVDSGAVYVVKTSNGGLNWSVPVEAININAAADLPLDRPWIAVDNSTTSSAGTVYIVSKSYKDAPFPHHVWLTSSSDSGATWSPLLLVDDSIPIGPSISSMGIPAVSADGKLSVLYLSYEPTQSLLPRYILASKYATGTAFNYDVVQTLPLNSFLSPADSLYQYSYHLAANPVDSGNLVAIWTDKRNGDPDIFSVRSVDAGLSWSSPLRVNSDSLSNTVGQDMCWAGFSPTGSYAAVWRDRRNGGTGQVADYRIYTSVSKNGGLTFSPDSALSVTGAPLFVPVDGNDFLGVALSTDKVYATWTDKRNTRNQLYTNSLFIDSLLTATQSPFNAEKRFLLFPNPADKKIILTTDCNQLLHVMLFDLQGKVTKRYSSDSFSFSGNQCAINIAGLSAGMYAVFFVQSDGKVINAGRVVVHDEF